VLDPESHEEPGYDLNREFYCGMDATAKRFPGREGKKPLKGIRDLPPNSLVKKEARGSPGLRSVKQASWVSKENATGGRTTAKRKRNKRARSFTIRRKEKHWGPRKKRGQKMEQTSARFMKIIRSEGTITSGKDL